MSPAIKYIAIALGLATVAYAGYYFFLSDNNGAPVSFSTSDVMMQNMLANSQLFIDRRQALEAVRLDTVLFTDARFLSLRAYTTPIQEQPIGRNDPFAPVRPNN